MGTHENPLAFTLSPGMAPAAPLMRMLGRFDRDKIEAFAEISIALLDLMDPDPEAEEIPLEDAFIEHNKAFASESSDDEGGAYAEWTSMRGSQKRGPNLIARHEDDEEDDPSGQCDEDGVNTMQILALGGGPGCSISDPGGCEHDGREIDEGY